EPSERLRILYRHAAKRLHPDLAGNDEERSSRERLMTEVNQAYEEADEERIRAVLDSWEASPESVVGNDVVGQLVRVIRQIARVRARLQAVTHEMDLLAHIELYLLKQEVDEAEKRGRNLLAEMACGLDTQILD